MAELHELLASVASLDFIAAQLRVPPERFLADPPAEGEDVPLPVAICGAWFAGGRVYVDLYDGRAIGMPLTRSRKLLKGRVDQLDRWTITQFGRAIAWPEIGEEIGLEDFFGLRMLEPAEES